MEDNPINYRVIFILLLGYGLLKFERGFFWTKEQNSVLADSNFYVALHELMPIWIWGIIGMLFSLAFIVAPFYLARQSKNKVYYYLLLIGGCGNAIFYFLMTSASIFHAINWLSPVQFATFTVIDVLISFYGGVEVARKR